MRPQLQETGIWASVAEREKSCEGWVSGTGDNTTITAALPRLVHSATLSLCANMKMTLSSIGFCTFSLAFTHIQSRRTVNKAISVLGTLLNKTKKKSALIAMAVCVSLFSNATSKYCTNCCWFLLKYLPDSESRLDLWEESWSGEVNTKQC